MSDADEETTPVEPGAAEESKPARKPDERLFFNTKVMTPEEIAEEIADRLFPEWKKE